MSSLRIVSLVPSATETVVRLGLGSALVGRSHACNFPPEVEGLPALTRPRLAERSSQGIHDEVRARLADGLALFDVDLEQLRALAPTHLLLQDQCGVCAVSPRDLETALAAWLGHRPEVVRLAPHQLADVWRDIESIGHALGRSGRAEALTKDLSHRLSDLAEAVGKDEERPSVACIEWLEPILIAGHWVPELVRLAGGRPVLAETGAPSREVSLETLRESAAEVWLLQPCGFDLPTVRSAWQAAAALRGAARLVEAPGSPPQRIALCDGDAYFNRPGPRLVESAELLAEVLHPDRVPTRHRGSGWHPA